MKIIDTKMHGRDGITGAFVLRGRQTALIETGPQSSLHAVLQGLQEEGVEDLDWIVVTHIHLDHAGAAGALVERFPKATVAVHEVGAPHLVDPSKLWSSATRIYGRQMDELWGGIKPVPRDRIRTLVDGDTIDLGGRSLTVLETTGHADHHHAYLDSADGTLFTGDALGVRLQDVGTMRPATPPPEFDLEDAVASIERIRDRAPADLCLTHFGLSSTGADALDVAHTCEAAIESLRRWAGWVRSARERSSELDEVAAEVRRVDLETLGSELTHEAIERMEQATSYRMNTWGYMRYLDKLEQHA